MSYGWETPGKTFKWSHTIVCPGRGPVDNVVCDCHSFRPEVCRDMTSKHHTTSLIKQRSILPLGNAILIGGIHLNPGVPAEVICDCEKVLRSRQRFCRHRATNISMDEFQRAALMATKASMLSVNEGACWASVFSLASPNNKLSTVGRLVRE